MFSWWLDVNVPQVPVTQLYIFFGKKKYLFSSFAHLLIICFFAVVIVIADVVLIWLPYTVWILIFYQKYDLQIFSPIQVVVFHFVDHLFCCEEVWCSSICLFLFLLLVHLVSYPPKIIAKTNVKELCLCFLTRVLWL